MCHLNSNNNSSRSTAISLLTGQFTISSFRCYYYYIVSYVYIFSAATYNNTHFPEQQSITKDSPRIVRMGRSELNVQVLASDYDLFID